MTRLQKLNEAHAVVKSTKACLDKIDKLKISLSDRNQFSEDLGAAREALELLRVNIQSIALKADAEVKRKLK